jgi:hypothetical protein
VDESSGAGQDEEGQQGLGLGQAKLGLEHCNDLSWFARRMQPQNDTLWAG